jgi:predicted transcriptional regulator of viral defense system
MKIDIYELLKEKVVWSSKELMNMLSIKNEKEMSVYLNRWVKKGYLKKIKRGLYTVYNDNLLIGSFIYKPSYIGLRTVISFHQLTTQLYHDVDVIVPFQPYKKEIEQFRINFFKINRKLFFGFKEYKYKEFKVTISDPEKTILDVLYFNILSIEEVYDCLNNGLNYKKLVEYLKKFNNTSMIQRLGFLLEKKYENEKEKIFKLISNKIYDLLKNKKFVYIKLDNNLPKEGKISKKWKIVNNSYL